VLHLRRIRFLRRGDGDDVFGCCTLEHTVSLLLLSIDPRKRRTEPFKRNKADTKIFRIVSLVERFIANVVWKNLIDRKYFGSICAVFQSARRHTI
jgi:hypothetical protein